MNRELRTPSNLRIRLGAGMKRGNRVGGPPLKLDGDDFAHPIPGGMT